MRYNKNVIQNYLTQKGRKTNTKLRTMWNQWVNFVLSLLIVILAYVRQTYLILVLALVIAVIALVAALSDDKKMH